MTLDVRVILGKALDVETLVRSNPGLFDFSKLDVKDKVELLKADAKFFMDKIDVTAFSPSDKVYVLLNSKNKGLVGLITLTDDELAKVPDNQYGELVRKHFSKFMRKERFPKLLKSDQQEIFLQEPAWVLAHVDKPPRLTSERLRNLAARKPSFVDTYIQDFSGFSTDDSFWISMIKFNDRFKKVFLENTKTLITKTQVRAVVWKYPDIIKMIDEDTLVNSKLTGKEWVLLISTIMEAKEDVFEDWQFPDNIAEMMKLDLMAELLNGKANMSVRFQNAMKGVFKPKDKEEENEDQALVGLTP